MHTTRPTKVLVLVLVGPAWAAACGQAPVQPSAVSPQAPLEAQATADSADLPTSAYRVEGPGQTHPFGDDFTLLRGAEEHELFTDGGALAPVSFDDIIGADAAKTALQELVSTLNTGEGKSVLGVRPAKGILLAGSPGVGKTLLARATATAAEVHFFITTGAAIAARNGTASPVENLQRLFETARQSAPAIVFIDELDVLKYDYALSKQLAVELDGFVANAQVYVIAAVNSLSGLDPALLRAGRFDHVVHVPMPDLAARQTLLHRITQDIPQADDVDFDGLATVSEGMSGADLANLANLAALRAQRGHKQAVDAVDWDEALDDVHIGPVNGSRVLTGDQAWRTAVHEAGHAAVATLISDAIAVRKATLVSRGNAAGYTQFFPPHESQVLDDGYYRHMLAVGLGGRAAEMLIFGQGSPGASADLHSVSDDARTMVARWGMGAKLGPVEVQDFDYMLSKYGDSLKTMVDEDTRDLVNTAHEQATALLRDNVHRLRQLAKALMAQRQLTGEDIRHILVDDAAPAGASPPARVDGDAIQAQEAGDGGEES